MGLGLLKGVKVTLGEFGGAFKGSYGFLFVGSIKGFYKGVTSRFMGSYASWLSYSSYSVG